jgi:hypothetical protein
MVSMSFFRFQSASVQASFARELVASLIKRYPLAADQDPSKRPSVNRMTRIVEEAAERAAQYQREQKLGWIARARFAHTFKWALLDAGYSAQFADVATEAVVMLTAMPAVKK